MALIRWCLPLLILLLRSQSSLALPQDRSDGSDDSTRTATMDASGNMEEVDTEWNRIEQLADHTQTAPPSIDLLRRLRANNPTDETAVSEAMLLKIATVLTTARRDRKTTTLVEQLQQQSEFAALPEDWTPRQIVTGLADTILEMERSQALTAEETLTKVQGEGLLPPQRFREYQDNPQLLLDDIQKSIYFTMVSYAAAGGYL